MTISFVKPGLLWWALGSLALHQLDRLSWMILKYHCIQMTVTQLSNSGTLISDKHNLATFWFIYTMKEAKLLILISKV